MNDSDGDTKETAMLSDISDNALFRNAMRDVAPLSTPNRIVPDKRSITSIPRKQKPGLINISVDLTTDDSLISSIESGDDWSFARPGVSHQTLRRLRRGYWPIQDNLDLHGYTRDIARQELMAFLENCTENQFRCVRVIHGKGFSSPNRDPILKKQVGHWLAQCSSVLAFYQAKPSDGGGGAVLVLLQTKKRHHRH
ncbi:DNA-nicking endonuclease, Smr domain [Nitrosomonas sp. PY1]|uniref:Smr/MutS family protein n=1 Tax=Nitrosomonas sp. PY1 TaxID=1803906 RepID=UPI001FC86AD7|nr:Smr/MutS family protein [Nitrosomonas sp. PY1]GKS69620.1 DNA-nicking endonuclease, Smr domain [Nitrosomonas sp. PY1]